MTTKAARGLLTLSTPPNPNVWDARAMIAEWSSLARFIREWFLTGEMVVR